MSKRKAEEIGLAISPKKQRVAPSPIKRQAELMANPIKKRPKLELVYWERFLELVGRLAARYRGSKERNNFARRVFWFYQ